MWNSQDSGERILHQYHIRIQSSCNMQALKRTGALGQDQILQEAIQEESDYRKSKPRREREQVQNGDLENLSDTIARYITDIIQ